MKKAQYSKANVWIMRFHRIWAYDHSKMELTTSSFHALSPTPFCVLSPVTLLCSLLNFTSSFNFLFFETATSFETLKWLTENQKQLQKIIRSFALRITLGKKQEWFVTVQYWSSQLWWEIDTMSCAARVWFRCKLFWVEAMGWFLWTGLW